MGKLPSEAKKVFSGKIFDVYQWEQKMFNGTTETFEMLKRPNTLLVIPVVGDKILLNKEEQPNKKSFITLPGGRQDKTDKSPLAGAKRELLEETGYVSSDWKMFSKVSPLTKIDWTIHTFIAKNCLKKKKGSFDAGEKIEPWLVSIDEFFDVALSNNFSNHDIQKQVMLMLLDKNKKDDFISKLGF